MKRWFILFIFLILGAHAAAAQSIIAAEVNQSGNASNGYQCLSNYCIIVEVNQSGNANWTMEKHIPLTTHDINDWEAAIKTGQNLSKLGNIAEFNDTMNGFIGSAQNFTNRSMKIEKLNISYDTAETLSGGFGIVRYSFWWMNFSRTNSDKIFIGDAFPEGLLVLSSDSVLVIEIPDGYDVKNASPSFDKQEGNRLIWEGHSFGKGEPSIVLQRTSVISRISGISGKSSISPVILVPLVILIAAGVAIFWKKRQSRNKARNDAEIEDTENDIESPLPFPYTEEDIGEEDLIEQFLVKSGGQAYQSDIVKERGLSKSKISMVLAKMKEEGKIIKVKKGKENLIRLVMK